MPLAKPLVAPLARRFQTTLTTATGRTVPKVRQHFESLGSWEENDVERFAAAAGESLGVLKRVAVHYAAGFYAALTGKRAPIIGVDDVATQAAVRDPFIALWNALSNGESFESAMASGLSRVEAMVANFATSSARQTGDVFVAKVGIRVTHFERIAEADACPWCEDVANDTYSSADAADFGHDRCGCSVVPVTE